MNALAGYQRSIVSPTPGTTRDVVTTRLAIDGWPVELSDTAGVRTGADALEEQGVGKAQADPRRGFVSLASRRLGAADLAGCR